MTTEEIWNSYYTSLYSFVLKRVGNTTVTKDILQNIFVKIHKHLDALQDASKAKSWVFQIARNELVNYYRVNAPYVAEKDSKPIQDAIPTDDFCCFERFLEELPEQYKKAITLVYIDGKTNADAADELQLSLPNVKAQIRRAKGFLKERFRDCCKYSINTSGKLIGQPDCAFCNSL